MSDPLPRLINNGMSESEKGFVELNNVETRTLERFAEWLYAMGYSSASPTEITVDIGDDEKVSKGM